jgi:hypothetical protein
MLMYEMKTNTIKRNKETLLGTTRNKRRESQVHFISHQNAEKKHIIMRGNKTFKLLQQIKMTAIMKLRAD